MSREAGKCLGRAESSQAGRRGGGAAGRRAEPLGRIPNSEGMGLCHHQIRAKEDGTAVLQRAERAEGPDDDTELARLLWWQILVLQNHGLSSMAQCRAVLDANRHQVPPGCAAVALQVPFKGLLRCRVELLSTAGSEVVREVLRNTEPASRRCPVPVVRPALQLSANLKVRSRFWWRKLRNPPSQSEGRSAQKLCAGGDCLLRSLEQRGTSCSH